MIRTTSELATPVNFRAAPSGGRLTHYLSCNKPIYTADLQWNLVLNVEHSGPKAETLPLSHRPIEK
ncbi:hypothetical protein AVEN_186256-1, partial [Araneus ventricosus]